MSEPRIMVSVFRSGRRQEMYIYVLRDTDWRELPDELTRYFGKPTHVMDLLLRPSLRLARADINRVMADIHDQGFYLQMPPRPELDPVRAGGRNET